MKRMLYLLSVDNEAACTTCIFTQANLIHQFKTAAFKSYLGTRHKAHGKRVGYGASSP